MDISIRKLYKTFNKNVVLNKIDLEIESQSSVVILGPSGTGKSVLLRCIAGLMQPESGEILIDKENVVQSKNIYNFDFFKRHEKLSKVGILFQNSALFDSLTIWENITFGLTEDSGKNHKKIAKEMLELVQLKDNILDLYPSEISGGMQKRVSLARTIAIKPQIILFDEPTTGLDPATSNAINDLIIKTIKHLKATSITVTHDINSAKKIADKIVFVKDGSILWQGNANEIGKIKNKVLTDFLEGIY